MTATGKELVLRTMDSLGAADNHYKVVEADKRFGKAFHESGRQLCLTKTVLESAQSQLGGVMETEDLERTIDLVSSTAETTEAIFKAVAQAPETSRIEQYGAVVRQVGKGKAVEVLLAEMMIAVCDVAKAVAIQDQVKELRDAIEKLSRLSETEPSVHEEGLRDSFKHYGSGNQFNAPRGTQNINTGSGTQLSEAKFSGPVTFNAR